MNRVVDVLSRRWGLWTIIVVVFILGGYFRVVGLNNTSSHGDALIHDVCKKGATPLQILSQWNALLGPSGQMAPPAAVTKLFLDIFHLPPTLKNVILPSALWGLIAVLSALWVGWRLGGPWFGALLMAVVSFNPMHIQMSRMAYFYPPCVVGGFLMLWCLVESWEAMKAGRPLTRRFHVVHAGAIALLLYSTASAWFVTVLMGLTHIALSLLKCRRKQVPTHEAILLMVTYGLIGGPLLFISWGLPEIMKSVGQTESTAYWRKIFEVARATPIREVASTELAKLGWGYTPVRGFLTGAVVAVGSVILMLKARREQRWALPLVWFVVGLTAAVIAIRTSTFPFGLRRVAALWPFWFVILAAGLAAGWLVEVPRPWKTVGRTMWSVFVALLLAMWIRVDSMVLKVNGFVIPYQRIGQWLDSHFQKGTPVITDRFFTAMCEFNNSDPTTNVVVLSTVPNEIPEIQEKTRFRDVTRQYFEENPDAVFYCQGHMYERPEVVPWQWPESYFRKRLEMRDDVQVQLCLEGQSYWGGYPGTVRWPVIYYNTLDDMIAIARQANRLALTTYGPEWRPVQTRDYQLWRLMLADNASLNVQGVGLTATNVVAEIQGAAVGGVARLKIGQSSLEFPPNQIVSRQVLLSLNAGGNLISVRRSGSPGGQFLVKHIAFFPATVAAPQ